MFDDTGVLGYKDVSIKDKMLIFKYDKSVKQMVNELGLTLKFLDEYLGRLSFMKTADYSKLKAIHDDLWILYLCVDKYIVFVPERHGFYVKIFDGDNTLIQQLFMENVGIFVHRVFSGETFNLSNNRVLKIEQNADFNKTTIYYEEPTRKVKMSGSYRYFVFDNHTECKDFFDKFSDESVSSIFDIFSLLPNDKFYSINFVDEFNNVEEVFSDIFPSLIFKFSNGSQLKMQDITLNGRRNIRYLYIVGDYNLDVSVIFKSEGSRSVSLINNGEVLEKANYFDPVVMNIARYLLTLENSITIEDVCVNFLDLVKGLDNYLEFEVKFYHGGISAVVGVSGNECSYITFTDGKENIKWDIGKKFNYSKKTESGDEYEVTLSEDSKVYYSGLMGSEVFGSKVFNFWESDSGRFLLDAKAKQEEMNVLIRKVNKG